ncbi:acyl-CoA thioester hydrolase/BAAT C-terminal domain-containing protein [Nocardioides sp. Iso805N]|uniref:acyl-CoA thioester hydrolase/BAAT C-terminal domain-containing protein n=1 Tax=Nocardioides sp. Iso805N TaxID=1283287 RepID=UPI000687C2FB|nr:acyl-CoA thioester hydrolase/BAAT C-terminal domain-containing protein [Nocardioides sp. Iso805N]
MGPVTAAEDLHWVRPEGGRGTGVLVLAGSSGRLDIGRAQALGDAGATALALRWFGGVGQPAVPCEVPLETFVHALDLLAPECDRLAVLGLSYGAEAALLTAVRDPRIRAVVALAPSDVAWEGYCADDADPPRSKWTWRGDPVPFVPLDRSWVPADDLPAFAPHYQRSRDVAGPSIVEAATIPVEEIQADLVLVAGGDDQVWPSVAAARAIEARRARRGLETVVIEDARAGHPVVLPGEPAPDPSRRYRVGGDAGAPQRVGERAWPAICGVLRLRPTGS